MLVWPSAVARTSTMVVLSHFRVPSDSGKSVGIRYISTVTFSIATSPEATRNGSVFMVAHDPAKALLLWQARCPNLQIRDDNLTRSDGGEIRHKGLGSEKRNCGSHRRIRRPGQSHCQRIRKAWCACGGDCAV